MRLIDVIVKRENQNLFAILQNQKEKNFLIESKLKTHVLDEFTFLISFAKDSYEDENRDIVLNIHGGGLITGSCYQNRFYCDWLAKQNFNVYALSYRLVPNVTFSEQLQDIFNEMNFIKGFKNSKQKVYLTADSAGALIALYAIACQKNETMARVFNVKPSLLQIDGVILSSGMFYTTGFNAMGLIMARYYYGKDFRKSKFYKYLKTPENLIQYLPRKTVFITFEKDFKRKDSERLLKNSNIYLLYGRDGDHSFNVLYPNNEQSMLLNQTALDFITEKE